MTTYIAIEHNSGYIWGVADAGTPELACSAIEKSADGSLPSRAWERVDPIRDTDGGYHVYLSDGPLHDDLYPDWQDRAAIDRVTKLPHVGDYRPVAEDE